MTFHHLLAFLLYWTLLSFAFGAFIGFVCWHDEGGEEDTVATLSRAGHVA